MSRATQKLVATTLTAAAALVVVLAAGLLTADAVAVQRRRPHDQAHVDRLLDKVQTDPQYADVLQAEYDRQTDRSLQREAHCGTLATILATAAAVFVVGAKWFITLRDSRLGSPKQVMAAHLASVAEPATVPDGAAAPRSLPILAEVDLSAVDVIVARTGRGPEAAIPILQAIQSHYRYLPDAALRRVCELTEITPAQLTGVATFYPPFRRTPIGEHVVTVCHGTACHVAGAPHISDELRRRLHIAPGEDTDPEQNFTVQAVPCLGCCTLAPVVRLDGVTHGHMRPDGVSQLLDLRKGVRTLLSVEMAPVVPLRQEKGPDPFSAGEVRVGLGSCCIASGSGAVYDAIDEALAATGLNAAVKRVGCVGTCHQTPFVEVSRPDGSRALYSCVRPEHARAIVRRHFKPRGLARRLRSTVASTVELLRSGGVRQAIGKHSIEPHDPSLAAFLSRQKHIATEHCGDLDPLDLDEYLERGGFKVLEDCLRQRIRPEQIIEQLRLSGLRGRGGAGHPTWLKWSKVRRGGTGSPYGRQGDRPQHPNGGSAGDTKYVICNGDEGDPGAFMDRMLMESYPYRLIEGVAIAACAVGAREGCFYIRAEYSLAVERIKEALRRCEERGLLGEQVRHRTAGTETGRYSTGGQAANATGPLRLRVIQGAGAFVCGEETGLIATLEGRRGMPTLRPPYPAERGLWGRPTLVNNVETFAVVPWILRNGPEAFAALGTETSKGTKVFALTGKIQRGGLIEVPMGITIREIVEDIGGGIRPEQTAAGPRRHTFKAVQIGGPSGGCVPADLADTPVDYEALGDVGAIMGSGGLVVLDEGDCMVDIARYFLSFTQSQSCGQCTPCRIGTRRMLEILDRLTSGEGRPDDLETLEHLAHTVRAGSLCGLGKTAPNPVLTTLRHFRDEYEAHLEGRCPAGRCKALIAYSVTDACTGCTLCAQHCPAGAIELRPYERHEIDVEKCTRCGVCRMWCPEDAISISGHSDIRANSEL